MPGVHDKRLQFPLGRGQSNSPLVKSCGRSAGKASFAGAPRRGSKIRRRYSFHFSRWRSGRVKAPTPTTL